MPNVRESDNTVVPLVLSKANSSAYEAESGWSKLYDKKHEDYMRAFAPVFTEREWLWLYSILESNSEHLML